MLGGVPVLDGTPDLVGMAALFAGGAVVAFLVLLAPGSIEQRSVTALVAGPAAGLLVHALGFVRAMSRRRQRRQEEVTPDG